MLRLPGLKLIMPQFKPILTRQVWFCFVFSFGSNNSILSLFLSSNFLMFIQEWVHYLNRGSQVNISYNVNSESSSVFLILAEGIQWKSFPESVSKWIISSKCLLNGVNEVIESWEFNASSYLVTLQEVRAFLNGLQTQHILIPLYLGTLFMVRWKTKTQHFLMLKSFYTDFDIIFLGSGMIEQSIYRSSSYYIALGNLNSEDVEVIVKI